MAFSCFFCCFARIRSKSELVRDLMLPLFSDSLGAVAGLTVALASVGVGAVGCLLGPSFLSSLARVSEI